MYVDSPVTSAPIEARYPNLLEDPIMKATRAVQDIASDPRRFMEFLQRERYPVYHKSVMFFRDLQYGLWRYLAESQTKVPYARIEKLAHDVVDTLKQRGILEQVDPQTFELNMPGFVANGGSESATAPAPATAKKESADAAAAPTESATSTPDAAADAMAARVAALKAKMEAAKATREGTASAATPPDETPSAPATAEGDKEARIAALKAKMAAAKAAREGDSSTEATVSAADSNPAPAEEPTAAHAAAAAVPREQSSAASTDGDDKAARIAELKRKMAEARAMRETGGS